MRLHHRALVVAATGASVLLTAAPVAGASGASVTAGPTTYSIGSASVDGVVNGPWTLSQPDTAAGQTQYPTADLFPYTPIGSSTSSQLSDLAAYPGATVGTAPYQSGQAGTPGPVDGYCASGGVAPESGTPVAEPTGVDEPMSPYYFPFVTRNADGTLTGYFDYRPKDTDEAVVSATSTDNGRTWTADGEALEQNRGYCADGDVNDNGQGHSWVSSIAGTTRLYTLNRVAGDAPGVGLIVHDLSGGESNPLAGLPASEPVGADPDTTTSAATTVPTAGGGTIPVTSVGTSGTATQLLAGQFVDTSAAGGSTDVITCTGVGTASLTGCTAPTAEAVGSGDTIEQVVTTVGSAVSIPAGPNNASESGGVTVTIGIPASAPVATAEEANLGAGRVYVDGKPVYCVGDTVAASSITLSNCTSPSALGAAAGDPVTLDPILPSTATAMTSGLLAPDGIVGTIPSYPAPGGGNGVPTGDTAIVYGEKLLAYYSPTTTTAAVTLPASGSTTTVKVASTAFLSSALYPQLAGFAGGSGTLTLSFGDNTSGGFASLDCTGFTATSFTGCSTTSGTAGDSVSNGSLVAIPGAALVPSTVLSQTGEGSTSSKKLYKNNEDYTVLRVAYTADGINFSSAGLANNGVISGSDPTADINDPTATASPSSTAPYNNPAGSPEPTELRFTGTRGSIIQNSDGSETMFLSGAWATDGDSDAFNQVFVTTSTDGEHWSTPVTVVGTDYTFSARSAQDAALASGSDQPLAVSGYYAGRTYSPAAVANPDGSVTLVFSGYGTPKPLPTVGSSIGTGSTKWTVAPADPALYRNILTLTLTPQPSVNAPESPSVIALPVLAGALLGVGALTRRRRRSARA